MRTIMILIFLVGMIILVIRESNIDFFTYIFYGVLYIVIPAISLAIASVLNEWSNSKFFYILPIFTIVSLFILS